MLTQLPVVLAFAALSSAPLATNPDASIVRIVEPAGNDISERPGREGTLYRAGDVLTDTKLPVGYPRPTPPGAIEIKVYPS
ncbi:MAG: hypothetical protein AAFY46_06070, partial [Planctomycetota bacterium]